MQIGRKIFYDLASGNVILTTGERAGYVVETTFEQDFVTHVQLSERVPDTIGMIQLEYGQYAQEFSDGSPTHVDPATLVITWTWWEPEVVEERKTLVQEIESLKMELIDRDARLADVELALADLFSEGGV